MGSRFVYAQLQSADLAGAKKFYGDLFGWTVKDDPPSQAPAYAEVEEGGVRIAGLMAAPPGTSSRWVPYISVDDLDSTASKAQVLGAAIVMAPIDVTSKGCRVCLLSDPSGALFALRGPLST